MGYEVTQLDALLESSIEEAWRYLVSAATREARVQAFGRMRDLINQRSPARVAEIERERGLRAS